MSEVLIAKQVRFATALGHLLRFAEAAGIAVVLGEAWRTEQQAKWNAAQKKGIVASLHRKRLAQDLIVMRPLTVGGYLAVENGSAPEYARLGAYWKSQGPDYCWGGDFRDAAGRPKPDAGHFSITHEGVK